MHRTQHAVCLKGLERSFTEVATLQESLFYRHSAARLVLDSAYS